jgi:hypothetical protein
VTEHVVVPLELGMLPYTADRFLADVVGRKGLEELGVRKWSAAASSIIVDLRHAFAAEYVMVGGGNASLIDPLPPHARRGGNADAFVGGSRLWEEVVEPHDRAPAAVWRVLG